MPRSVVNPVYKASADRAFAAGGFRPRRKGEHRISHKVVPDFPSQQGTVHSHLELRPNTIASVQRLPDFLGYGCHGNEVTFRAFAVTLVNGQRVPMYSRNTDTHIMCLHSGYKPQ